ncbi:hypothetical protein [Polymorphobacter sp.]
MKIAHQGFEPEIQAPATAEIRRPAPRKTRVRLQLINTDSRLFHAYTA